MVGQEHISLLDTYFFPATSAVNFSKQTYQEHKSQLVHYQIFTRNSCIHYPTNTPRGFPVETTWELQFPRRFYVESTWCVCRKQFQSQQPSKMLIHFSLLQCIRREAQLNIDKIKRQYRKLQTKRCCLEYGRIVKTSCIKKVSFTATVLRLRKWFWEKKESGQNQFLLDFFESQKQLNDIRYTVDNTDVCNLVWRFCYGITKTRQIFCFAIP